MKGFQHHLGHDPLKPLARRRGAPAASFGSFSLDQGDREEGDVEGGGRLLPPLKPLHHLLEKVRVERVDLPPP